MPQFLAAYVLMGLLAILIAGAAAWLRHNSHERLYRRRLRREARAHRERIRRDIG
jgi:hypothetical protein